MILINWKNDWFVGRALTSQKYPDWRFMIQGAEKWSKHLHLSLVKNRPYKLFFSRDPGFIYYPVIKYCGSPVSPQGIVGERFPRETNVFWDGRELPPDLELWNGEQVYGSMGLYRCIRIVDLEIEKGTIPDWSMP